MALSNLEKKRAQEAAYMAPRDHTFDPQVPDESLPVYASLSHSTPISETSTTKEAHRSITPPLPPPPDFALERSFSEVCPTLPPIITGSIPSSNIFPPTFSIYEHFLSRTRTIGEHKDTPLFCFSEHTGAVDPYHFVLHSGPTKLTPRLTGIRYRPLRSSFDVTICSPGPVVENQLDTTIPVEKGPRGILTRRFEFTIEVHNVRETFQWRSFLPHGPNIYFSPHNWVLLRKSDRQPPGTPHDWRPEKNEKFEGMEVVARWEARRLRRSKIATFSFEGAGRRGELGGRWEVMAVATGGWLIVRELEKTTMAASTGVVSVAT